MNKYIGTVHGGNPVHPLVTHTIYEGILSAETYYQPSSGVASWEDLGGFLPWTAFLFGPRDIARSAPAGPIFADIAYRVLQKEIPIPEALAGLVPAAPLVPGTTALGSLIELRPARGTKSDVTGPAREPGRWKFDFEKMAFSKHVLYEKDLW